MSLELADRYDFIVTGASGNVGRRLIPILADRGNRVLAVARNASALRALYAEADGIDVADYNDLASHATCDTLIHLAVRNNDKPGTLDEFMRVNVDFAMEICEEFCRMGGRRFVNLSSIQTLDENNLSPYAVSKEMQQRRLEKTIGERLDNIYIGYFYGKNYFGEKLYILNKLGIFGDIIFRFFKTVKPTTSNKIIADYVCKPAYLSSAPIIITDDLSNSWIYRVLMRILDLTISLGVLIVLLPALVILWALIRIDSPGPAIFRQTRVGKAQVPFTLYKFRTMKVDTVVAATHEVSVSATTKIGKFLRKTKLDELPQAVNLLRGEMTLVGPRPCLPIQEELLNARAALGVYAIKPGITGYAQIREIDMSRPKELATSDYVYMKLRSIIMDVKLVLATALGRGKGDRVSLSEKL